VSQCTSINIVCSFMGLNKTTSRYEYGVSYSLLEQLAGHAKLWSYRRLLGFIFRVTCPWPLRSIIHIRLCPGTMDGTTQSLPWKLRAPFRACQQDRATPTHWHPRSSVSVASRLRSLARAPWMRRAISDRSSVSGTTAAAPAGLFLLSLGSPSPPRPFRLPRPIISCFFMRRSKTDRIWASIQKRKTVVLYSDSESDWLIIYPSLGFTTNPCCSS